MAEKYHIFEIYFAVYENIVKNIIFGSVYIYRWRNFLYFSFFLFYFRFILYAKLIIIKKENVMLHYMYVYAIRSIYFHKNGVNIMMGKYDA